MICYFLPLLNNNPQYCPAQTNIFQIIRAKIINKVRNTSSHAGVQVRFWFILCNYAMKMLSCFVPPFRLLLITQVPSSLLQPKFNGGVGTTNHSTLPCKLQSCTLLFGPHIPCLIYLWHSSNISSAVKSRCFPLHRPDQ